MRILCVSDCHSNSEALTALDKLVKTHTPDLTVMVGDWTQFGPQSFINDFLGIAPNTIGVAGNCDTLQVVESLEKKGISLHLKVIEKGGYCFVGFQGSLAGPARTPIEYSEKDLEELAPLVNKKIILVTHEPPYDTNCDLVSSGLHVGSKTLRKIIETKQPLAVICGHIHQSRAIDRVGKTLVVNPGPLYAGNAAMIELPSLKAELLRAGPADKYS